METTLDISGCPDQHRVRVELCPRNELKKVELELLNHVMVGAEQLVYTTRFHELAALAPDIVPTLEKRIEWYVGGLPSCIQGHVIAAHPTTLEMVVTLSATLTDMMVASSALKKETGTTKELEQHPAKKQKVVKNFATTTTTKEAVPTQPQLNHQTYSGMAPLCDKCKYHHQ
ncbi:hypothetical protein E3N88_23322 [Mikania micrantha]|uniref:Uncharacterized protein n=1 Tax=Mikania micrantha TaxID=192012 RepID=A0A5N6NCZ3_9ASTR|nr:hypothetical protein E3N88_23322 [Mikania micrantha]